MAQPLKISQKKVFLIENIYYFYYLFSSLLKLCVNNMSLNICFVICIMYKISKFNNQTSRHDWRVSWMLPIGRSYLCVTKVFFFKWTFFFFFE